MKNQHEKIRNYMRTHESITPMDAWNHLHITKLSTRIGEMIRNGEKIDKEMVCKKTESGETVKYMKYRLAG